jgi:anti-sigma B factor antagonist
MKITNYASGEYDIIKIHGNLDMTTSPEANGFLSDYVEDSRTSIIIDMAEVEYIDSTGIGTLVNLLKRLIPLHGKLILLSLPKHIENLFNKTKIFQFFHLAKDISELPGLVNEP